MNGGLAANLVHGRGLGSMAEASRRRWWADSCCRWSEPPPCRARRPPHHASLALHHTFTSHAAITSAFNRGRHTTKREHYRRCAGAGSDGRSVIPRGVVSPKLPLPPTSVANELRPARHTVFNCIASIVFHSKLTLLSRKDTYADDNRAFY